MKIFKKEKEVVELALRYLEVIEKCVQSAENAVTLYLNGDRQGAATLKPEVGTLESKSR